MPRVVVLGCGTAVGKTRLSVAVLRELARSGESCLGLKPIESGLSLAHHDAYATSDAAALASAGSLHAAALKHPLYALALPVSPHLAARAENVDISLAAVAQWTARAERECALLVASRSAIWTVIESAGGVFSPLSAMDSNFDLALALEPATWVLVAADALGVLHDVSATLQAMRARGRMPDHVVLSAARAPDASTGTNGRELSTLGIVTPTAVIGRDDDHAVADLVQALLLAQACQIT